MRPLKLVMTGFESYKDRTEINFEDLGKNGLYLIAGDTGAGKTTIFDAITFALYGSPSGTDRSVDMLRSHFADENIPTEVELDFEANGKKYRIKRNPDYERKVLRGIGITKEAASAKLFYLSEDHEPVTGLTEVGKAIDKILCLKKDQFCRIAMIAQGSFQKLLLSDKNEKGKIFRELFHTEKYDRIQSVLGEEKKDAKKILDELNLKFKDALSRIEVNENDESYDDVMRIKTSEYIRDEEINLLKSFVSKDEKLLSGVVSQISEIEKNLEEIINKLQIGENRRNIENQISSSTKILNSKKSELTGLEQVLAEAEKAAEKIPELTKDKNLLEPTLSLYEEISKAENELKDFIDEINKDEVSRDSFVKTKSDRESEIETLKEELESLKNAGEKIGTFEAALEKNIEENNGLLDIEAKLLKLSKDKKSLSMAQDDAGKANDAFTKANISYTEMINLFNLEQAGILAETLKEGMPCPVCGSLEHPHLALKSDKAPTQKEIKDAKEEVDALREKANSLALEAGNKKGIVETSIETVNGLLSKYFENLTEDDSGLSDKIQSKKNQNEKACFEIRNALKKEKEGKARRELLEKKIPDAEKIIKEISSKIADLEIKISASKAKLEADTKNLDEKKSGLKFRDYKSAKAAMDKLDGTIAELNSNVEAAKNAKSECENVLSKKKGEVDGLMTQLKQTPEVDVEKLTSDRNNLNASKENLNSQRDSMNERKGINQESVRKIEELLPKISKASGRFDMISALYEVATGSNRSKGKPSLETYVQMHCLDQINRRANLRLKTMTDNKYELRRRIEDDGSELGLDLNVKDFYTGRERNVHTLSGGEQFQASLSLALGLADEIQANSGGIKLDAMFIDEGFGTLDGDTLNKAMKALEDLSQGNKLVGIISHVDELEARVPNKIYVKKDDFGVSHTRMVKD